MGSAVRDRRAPPGQARRLPPHPELGLSAHRGHHPGGRAQGRGRTPTGLTTRRRRCPVIGGAITPSGKEMLMAIPAELMTERAAAWAESDPAVRAMIVYGSLAQGSADEDSDLDVIIVAEPGQRDALWDRREQISDLIHGGHDAVWH